jgi:hypothetical protein
LCVSVKNGRINRRERNANKSKLVKHDFDKCQMNGYRQAGAFYSLNVTLNVGNTIQSLMYCILIIIQGEQKSLCT